MNTLDPFTTKTPFVSQVKVSHLRTLNKQQINMTSVQEQSNSPFCPGNSPFVYRKNRVICLAIFNIVSLEQDKMDNIVVANGSMMLITTETQYTGKQRMCAKLTIPQH